MGDFRKKNILQTDFDGEKYLARKYLMQKMSCTGKKKCRSCCTVICRYMFGENPKPNHPYSPLLRRHPPQTSIGPFYNETHLFV